MTRPTVRKLRRVSSLITLELQMVTTAHFMHDVYGPFDEPVQLRAPRSGTQALERRAPESPPLGTVAR